MQLKCAHIINTPCLTKLCKIILSELCSKFQPNANWHKDGKSI